MRYRLIPSKGAMSWHAEGLLAARESAKEAYLASATKPEERVPVLLCEAPIGGIVKHLETIGGTARRMRRS